MPAFPPSLPAFRMPGVNETLPDGLIRSEVDVGPAKVRRRTSAGVRLLSGSMTLTREQAATLDAFYTTTLQAGALSFDWRHPRTKAAIVCRFRREPTLASKGPSAFEAQLELEILPG